ncbi:hypothetical protein [Mucilaginibacter sp. HD30]
MKTLNNTIGGFAGAAALNIVHQTAKQFIDKAPRVDLIGEQALNKGLKGIGAKPLTGNTLFLSTLAADIINNAAYYSMIGWGRKKNLLIKGAAFGLAAGIGALTLTKPLGLNDRPVNKSTETKLLTVSYYLLGGIVAALTIKALTKKVATVQISPKFDEEIEVIGNS